MYDFENQNAENNSFENQTSYGDIFNTANTGFNLDALSKSIDEIPTMPMDSFTSVNVDQHEQSESSFKKTMDDKEQKANLEACKKELGWKDFPVNLNPIEYTLKVAINRLVCLFKVPLIGMDKKPAVYTSTNLIKLLVIGLVEIVAAASFVGAIGDIISAVGVLIKVPGILFSSIVQSAPHIGSLNFPILIIRAIVEWIVFGIARITGMQLNKNPNDKAIHTVCALLLILLLIIFI